MEPPLRRCFGKAGILNDDPSESAPDDPPLEIGEGLRTVKDTGGVEVMIHQLKRHGAEGQSRVKAPPGYSETRPAASNPKRKPPQVTADLALSAT